MDDEYLKARNRLSGNVALIIQLLEDATKLCSEKDIEVLHKHGVLPTGIRDYLVVIRG